MDGVGDGEFEAQNDAALGEGVVSHDGFRTRQDADRPLMGWVDGLESGTQNGPVQFIAMWWLGKCPRSRGPRWQGARL